MKTAASLIGLTFLFCAFHAPAKDYVLLDTDKAPQEWLITSQELGLKVDKLSRSASAICTEDDSKECAWLISITAR